MKRTFYFSLGLLSLTLMVIGTGCSSPNVRAVTADTISVTGTATYRERMMLPPNAVFKATVEDVSRADAATAEIGHVTLTKFSAPPISFSIAVERAKIDQNKSYAVRAQILVDGKLLFTSDTAYPVLTRGAASRVDILLKRVQGGKAPHRGMKSDASLTNTYWKIITLDGEKIPLDAGQREPHMILKVIGSEKRFTATVGCNQLAGGFSLTGDEITFTAPMSTRMACPPPLDRLEKHLGKVLIGTKGWRVAGDTLELLDGNGSPIAVFTAVYL